MPTKKTPKKKGVGGSRGRRGMFLRIPHDLYEKLRRMTATRLVDGERASVTGTVIQLIEQAKEPK